MTDEEKAIRIDTVVIGLLSVVIGVVFGGIIANLPAPIKEPKKEATTEVVMTEAETILKERK